MRRCPSRCVAAIVLLICLTGPGSIRAAPPDILPDPGCELRIHLRDGATGGPVAARVSISDGGRLFFHPISARSCGFHQPSTSRAFFYADGDAAVRVPPGRIILRVFHGFEYQAREDTLNIALDTDVTLKLVRLVDMPALGWRSGDTHVHMTHGGLRLIDVDPGELFVMQRAEDLHVLNALENDPGFTGEVDPRSTPDHLLFFGIEYRSGFWGHLGMLGTSAPTLLGCCSRGQPAFPLNADVAARARALGGTVIFAHPFCMNPADLQTVDQGWPSVGFGREVPIDVALGAVDALDVYSYSNLEAGDYHTWYDLLNHGFHIPASAGTDACVNRTSDEAPGGYRVYARVGAGAWDYQEWLAALRRGESFITNGPLVCAFTVAGHAAGETFEAAGKEVGPVACHVEARSQWPLGDVEIVVNGEVRGTLRPRRDPCRVNGTVLVDAGDCSAWIAARGRRALRTPFTVGPDLLFHTNPVYREVPGRPLLFDGADPVCYLAWLETVWAMALGRGFDSGEDRLRLNDLMREARASLAARLASSGWRGDDLPPPPEDARNGEAGGGGGVDLRVAAVAPRSAGTLEFRFMGGEASPVAVELFDVAGRCVAARRILPTEMEGSSWTWRPGDRAGDLPSGVYFARFTGPGWNRTVRAILVH